MVRQHPAADGDRPHYFSQYWINVALGKPVNVEEAAPASAATATIEPELELPPIPTPIHPEPVKPAKKAPEKKPDRISSLADLASIANIEELMKSSAAMPDDAVPDIEANAAIEAEPPIVTDFDLTEQAEEPVAEVEEDEGIEPYEDYGEFDEEEEEDDEWGGRRPGKGGGSKKPGKQQQRPPRRREF